MLSALAFIGTATAPVALAQGTGLIARGSVVLPDSATPAAGVIVSVEAADGTVVTRALSDERGLFTLRLASASVFRVRALRIGFQPTVLSSVEFSESSPPLRIVLGTSAVALPKVSVRGADICRGLGGDGAMVAAIWEEARKALLASGLSATTPLTAEWVEYERTMDTTGRFIRAQRVRSTRTATTHAFKSAPATLLADSGYVIDTNDGTVFHAPDADVLLSDSFAANHCFHVEPPEKGKEYLVGVGFTPARERQRASDILGTFWIDRVSSELRSLEYRYTNLPAVTDHVRPGGQVEFLRLPSGSWLVNRWQIRMPQLIKTTPTTMRRRGVTVSTTGTAVTAVRQVGGEVSRVERENVTLYRANGTTLSLELASSDSTLSTADVRVALDGTDYEVLSDRRGRALIPAILPGQYRLRAQSPLMDSLGVESDPVELSVHEGETRPQRIALPTSAELLRRVCGNDARADQGAHLRGLVVDSVGLPVSNAEIRLRWQQQIAIVRDRLVWNERSVTTKSDSVGLWQFCAVPRDAGIQIGALAENLSGRASTRIPDSVQFASAVVQIRAEPITAGVIMNTEASVSVTITDGAQRPLRDVQISLTGSVGVPRRLRTDSSGRASAPRLPAGVYGVDVRKVGYTSGTLSVDLEPGQNTLPLVLEKSAVPQLAEVRVIGDRVVVARHADFERRKAAGEATAVISQEEIEKRNPAHSWQLLTRVPSLLVLDSLGAVYARTTRMSVYPCWPRVAIDGKILQTRPNLAVELPPPNEIYGIEVYAGSARLPVEVPGEGDQRFCGLIMVWTR